MFYPAVVNSLVTIREMCHFCGGEKQWKVITVHWTSLGAEDLEMTPNLLIPGAGDPGRSAVSGRMGQDPGLAGKLRGSPYYHLKIPASTIATISTLRG